MLQAPQAIVARKRTTNPQKKEEVIDAHHRFADNLPLHEGIYQQGPQSFLAGISAVLFPPAGFPYLDPLVRTIEEKTDRNQHDDIYDPFIGDICSHYSHRLIIAALEGNKTKHPHF